jgi:SAM-dependent methyltransferase
MRATVFMGRSNVLGARTVLRPVFGARDRSEFELGLQNPEFAITAEFERHLIESTDLESYTVEGFCVPCGKTVPFLVDMQSGGQRVGNLWVPNWRERLVCPSCGMNNRQRLIAALVRQSVEQYKQMNVYFMEQVTSIFQWAVASFPRHDITGSEYLGYEFKSGDVVQGVRHEDVLNMSFPDNSFDLIVSNDVLEHVPSPEKALQECVRVLRPGGTMLVTIPFFSSRDASVTRAEVVGNTTNHLLPPAFHGNPVSENGSLVFTDFGWDIFRMFLSVGFSDAVMEIYLSRDFGHLGTGLSVFKLTNGGTQRLLDRQQRPPPRIWERLRTLVNRPFSTG